MAMKDAQLGALRERGLNFTPAQLQAMGAQRYFAESPLSASVARPLSDPFAVTEEAALRELLAQTPEAMSSKFQAGAAETALGLLDPISTAAGLAGQAAGLTPEQRQALEIAVGTVSPGPGEYTTAGKVMLGNMFLMPPSGIQKRVAQELSEKWLGIGEKAAREGRPELLSQAITNLTDLSKREAQLKTLRKAAAQYATEFRRTIGKKGTEIGEALRSRLIKKGPGEGTLQLAPGKVTEVGMQADVPGGEITIAPEELRNPFALGAAIQHEVGHPAAEILRRDRPDLYEALMTARGPWREPESETALALRSSWDFLKPGSRQEALRLTREAGLGPPSPRPHGATPEAREAEEIADLLAQLTSATGQATLKESQIAALRGKLGGIVPGLR